MKEEKCPCCPNHCDKDNLNCGRGKDYFNGKENDRKQFRNNEIEVNMTDSDKVISQMRKCGHILHHNRHNVNLNFLSEEELNNLEFLLSKCLKKWQ